MNRPAPRHRRNRSSIEDVAAAAGVSVATVSRALRGLPNVADSTRERVKAVAEQLDYRANPAASRLAMGRSKSVAIVVPIVNSWYFSNVVAGAAAACAEAGYDTIVTGVGAAMRDADVVSAIKALRRRVDAAIFVDITVSDAELETMAAQSLVVMSVGRGLPGVPSVGIDDVEVGRLATQHLIDLGHEKIGVIRGPEHDPFSFAVPNQRLQGHEQAMIVAGLPIAAAMQTPGSFTIQDGVDGFRALMDADEPPTAIFSLADEIAFGVIHAAAKAGTDIPRDLSLIGVDDHEFAPIVGLTTVHQDVSDHGARAGRAVISMLEGEELSPNRSNAPVRLVERRTTAALLGR